MKPLSKVLNDTKNISEQIIQTKNSSNTQAHGLTTNVGMISTQPSRQPIQSNKNTKKLLSEECSEQKTPISECYESRKKLTLLVKACFDSLNTYGKGADGLEAVTMLMHMVLGKFDYKTVRAAFNFYLENNSDMPKPSDIVKIINPSAENKKWCATTFIDIQRRKREGQFITDKENEYCKNFLNAKMNSCGDEGAYFENAIKQVEAEDKKYWGDN